MKYAVLSDIHSNLEALEEACRFLDREKIKDRIILGDMVGYGANPNECLELIAAMKPKAVAGNHDYAVFDDKLAEWFNPFALEAILWTRKKLEPKWVQYLKDLPLIHLTEDFTMAHGSIAEPEAFEYLYHFGDAEPSFQKMQTPLGWIGHTHVPMWFVKNKKTAAYLKEGTYPLEEKETYLINPGSVGQPRDRDPRLSLAVFDGMARKVTIHRLGYDNQKAAGKIRKAGLPAYLADRLL